MRTADALRQVEIGKRIRTIRLEKKIRQVDLAAGAGMSWRHLIRMEQGQGGEPKPETLGRLAEALGVERSDLTGEDDEEEPELPSHRRMLEVLYGALGAALETTEPTASLAEATAGSDSNGG